MAALPFDGQNERKKRRGKRAGGDGGLSAFGALDLMRQEGNADGVFTVASRCELARILKWERTRTSKALDRWAATGAIVLDDDTSGNILIRVMHDRDAGSDGKGSATSPVEAPRKQRSAPRETARPSRREHARPTAREITAPTPRETVAETPSTPATRPGIDHLAEAPDGMP